MEVEGGEGFDFRQALPRHLGQAVVNGVAELAMPKNAPITKCAASTKNTLRGPWAASASLGSISFW